MFSDYLYDEIDKNLITDSDLFKDTETALKLLRSRKPITKNTRDTIIARFLFAKTLKKLLEDPNSDLSKELRNQKKLRETLRKAYIHSITQINDWYGYRFAVPMPGPFVVPNITTVAGKNVSKISEGTYGIVYKTDADMAVKNMKSDVDEIDPSTMREIAVIHYLDHPNIISFTAIQLDPPKIAMPLADGTLENFDFAKGNINSRKWVFFQLFRGLAYIHSKHIWHLDIKPANILYFDDPNISGEIIKIADFGLAHPYARPGDNSLSVVTAWWRAPEIFLGDTKYDQRVDVWALGVMLLEAIADLHIFPGKDGMQSISLIFGQLGKPTDTDWPGVTQLSEWKRMTAGLKSNHPRRLSVDRIPGTTTAPVAFDPQEYEVIDKTVTWPNLRLSALDVLKLPYFDSIRDAVEVQIPSYPITVESCGDLMLTDQRQYVEQSKLTTWRMTSYGWLLTVNKHLKFKKQTLFYAMELIDIVLEKTTDTALFSHMKNYHQVAALYISAQLYEQYPGIEDDYVDITSTISTVSELLTIVRNILTLVDFELVFPTCDDFIVEYLDDKSQYTEITDIAFYLYFSYAYATQYTASQIAQIAIEAIMTTRPKCLEDKPKLYDASIQKYLIDIWESRKVPFKKAGLKEPQLVNLASTLPGLPPKIPIYV